MELKLTGPPPPVRVASTIRTVLVPLLNLGVAPELVQLAAALAAGTGECPPPGVRVIVLGVVEVPKGQHLADGRNMARSYRALLSFLPSQVEIGAPGQPGCAVPVHHTVRVAHTVAAGIREAVRSSNADLLLLHWKGYASDPQRHNYGETLDNLLADPPADLLLARANGWRARQRVLVPVRGGPTAELALDIGMVLARRLGVGLTVMHSVPRAGLLAAVEERPTRPAPAALDAAAGAALARTAAPDPDRLRGDEPYLALAERLARLEGTAVVPLEHVLTVADDVGAAVSEELQPGDLVVLGAPGAGAGDDPVLHPVVGRVLGDPPDRPVLLVRARTPLDLAAYRRRRIDAGDRHNGRDRPSPEQWFVENTYHADEFRRIETWQAIKAAYGARVSVVVPTLNDGARLARLLHGLRQASFGNPSLVDEILVVDAGSTDSTLETIGSLGLRVIATVAGGAHGPAGPAVLLQQALTALSGDLVVWIDPKAGRVNTRVVPVLTGALLTDPDVQLVKPFWVPPAGGTELAPPAETGARFARLAIPELLITAPHDLSLLPMRAWFRTFVPALGAVVEPVGRIFAARRSLLEALIPALTAPGTPALESAIAFYAALLLETVAQHGVHAVAQVELERHRSRHARPPAEGADVRQLRQVGQFLRLLTSRPEGQPHLGTLQRLQVHLAGLGEI